MREGLVTYDARMAEAAEANGIVVLGPRRRHAQIPYL